jgi:hypothetical protein
MIKDEEKGSTAEAIFEEKRVCISKNNTRYQPTELR